MDNQDLLNDVLNSVSDYRGRNIYSSLIYGQRRYLFRDPNGTTIMINGSEAKRLFGHMNIHSSVYAGYEGLDEIRLMEQFTEESCFWESIRQAHCELLEKSPMDFDTELIQAKIVHDFSEVKCKECGRKLERNKILGDINEAICGDCFMKDKTVNPKKFDLLSGFSLTVLWIGIMWGFFRIINWLYYPIFIILFIGFVTTFIVRSFKVKGFIAWFLKDYVCKVLPKMILSLCCVGVVFYIVLRILGYTLGPVTVINISHSVGFNNSVGSDWFFCYYVDGKSYSGLELMNLDLSYNQHKLTVKAVEDDSIDDTGIVSFKFYNDDFFVIKNGNITVIENRGRYSGNRANVNVRVIVFRWIGIVKKQRDLW